MKRIGIVTVFTGFNYGSSLQAYATKVLLGQLGYEGVVLGQCGSIVQGRDVRIKKLITMMFRLLIHPSARNNVKVYRESIATVPTESTKALFTVFSQNYIKPKMKKWGELKALARSDEFAAFLCGSDQIWNADALYVDPFYYLQFAPKNKRIAFSPSFGREKVADYNNNIIAKYIKSIPVLSIREESGVKIVQELIGKSAEHLMDPTLLLSREEWNDALHIRKNKGEYILAYFLNAPSTKAINTIKGITEQTKKKVIALPYREHKEDWFDESKEVGPKEFVEIIANAEFICTDSFHGTAFAVNYNVPFYAFDRRYGTATKQSSRIESLLALVGLEKRFNSSEKELSLLINFENAEIVLKKERKKAKDYLQSSIG